LIRSAEHSHRQACESTPEFFRKKERISENSCQAYTCHSEDTCGYYYIGCKGERRKSSRNMRRSTTTASGSGRGRRKRGIPNTYTEGWVI